MGDEYAWAEERISRESRVLSRSSREYTNWFSNHQIPKPVFSISSPLEDFKVLREYCWLTPTLSHIFHLAFAGSDLNTSPDCGPACGYPGKILGNVYLDISHLHHTIERLDWETGQVCTLSVLTIFIEVPNCSSMKICHWLSTCNRKGEKRAGHSTNRSAVRWCWPMGEEERIVVATIQANLDLTMVQIKLQYLHKKGVCRWASPGIGISFSSSTLSLSTLVLLSLINSVWYLIVFLSTEC